MTKISHTPLVIRDSRRDDVSDCQRCFFKIHLKLKPECIIIVKIRVTMQYRIVTGFDRSTHFLRRLETKIFRVEIRSGGEHGTQRNKRTYIGGNVLSNRVDTSNVHRADTTDWKYAVADAYSGFAVWTDLWLEIWTCGRVFYTVAADCGIWDADLIPHGDRNGI